MSLAMVAKGRSVKVVSVLGGHGMQNKLAAMGIARGQDVRVISNYGGGPLVVAVLDSRVMLGRGMANKILVS